MEITEKRDVVLARVDWNDDLEVELEQERRRGVYTVDQAEELAAKLIFASAEIRKQMVRDDVEREARLRAEPLAEWERDFVEGRPIGEHADRLKSEDEQ